MFTVNGKEQPSTLALLHHRWPAQPYFATPEDAIEAALAMVLAE
jgi:hypothetical protein